MVEGNTVNGASDVGISISGDSGTRTRTVLTNAIASDNIVENVNLNISPFLGGNGGSGDGILDRDNGAASNVTVIGNTVQSTASNGVIPILASTSSFRWSATRLRVLVLAPYMQPKLQDSA